MRRSIIEQLTQRPLAPFTPARPGIGGTGPSSRAVTVARENWQRATARAALAMAARLVGVRMRAVRCRDAADGDGDPVLPHDPPGTDASAIADALVGSLLWQHSARAALSARAVHQARLTMTGGTDQRSRSLASLTLTLASVYGSRRMLGTAPGWAAFLRRALAAASLPADPLGEAIARYARAVGELVAGPVTPALPGPSPQVAAAVAAGLRATPAKWGMARTGGIAEQVLQAISDALRDSRETGTPEDPPPTRQPTPDPVGILPSSPPPDRSGSTSGEAEAETPEVETLAADPDEEPHAAPAVADSVGRTLSATVDEIDRREPLPGRAEAMAAQGAELRDRLTRHRLLIPLPPTRLLGRRAGDLDPAALPRLAWQDARVFARRPEEGVAALAVALLIDGSGSMARIDQRDGRLPFGDARLHRAASVGWAIADAWKDHPRVSMQVWSHTATRGDRIASGWEARVMLTRYPEPRDLAGLEMMNHRENGDGYAIAHLAGKLRTTRAVRRLLVVVSDGSPNISGTVYRDGVAAAHTTAAVEDARAVGVSVVGVGIADDAETHGPGIYGSGWISGEDQETLGEEIGRAILAAIGGAS